MTDKRAYDGTFDRGFRKVTSRGIVRIDKAIFKMNNTDFFGKTVFCVLDSVKIPNVVYIYLSGKYFSQKDFIEKIEEDIKRPVVTFDNKDDDQPIAYF